MSAIAFAAPEQFESTVVRITLGAALGGLCAGMAALAGGPGALFAALVLAGALALLGTRRSFFLLAAVGGVAGALIAVGSAYPTFYLASAGAVAGSGIALARFLASEAERRSLTAMRLALVAIAGAGALLVGAQSAEVFAARGLFAGIPVPLGFAARGAVMGFFLALAAAALHLQAGSDPVETLHARLAGELTGELGRLCSQAIDLYRRCREALAKSPQSAARAHVGRSLAEVTSRAMELARRWHAVDLELGERAEGELEKRVTELGKLAAASTDATAKRQLQAAERALGEERAQLARVRAGRERVMAQLHADLAILERTRFALLALRCTDAHLVVTELSHLSENLSALGREMDGEAQAIDEALRAAVSPVVPVGAAGATTTSAAERVV